MPIEKIYARFMEFVDLPKGKASIRTDAFTLLYVDYDEETTKRLLEEASHYEVCNFNVYNHKNDVYGAEEHSVTRYGVQVDKLVSISSPCYCSDEPQVDCLVVDGHFAGVVVFVERVGGNGWNNYRYENYALLYTDGRVVGNNEASYCFSGEDSDREDIRTYSLHRIK